MVQEKIDFKQLRRQVFGDDDGKKKEKLEAFLYQKLPQQFLEKLSPSDPAVVYDVPLLFEKNLSLLFDVKVLVYAPAELQLKRLVERDAIPVELAQKMLAGQWPIEEKKKLVDFIIDNSGTKEKCRRSFDDVFNEIFTDFTFD